MSEWISVEDRLPTFNKCLVRTTHGITVVASRQGKVFQRDGELYFFDENWNWGVINDISFNKDEVTHWMPLPQPPKEN